MILNSPSQIHGLLDARRFLNYGTGPGGAFGAAPNYVRTAFISSTGNDGTAVLNDPELPFNNLSAAVAALEAAYTGFSTTIRLLSTISQSLDGGLGLGLLQFGLTIRSHDATRHTLNGVVRLYGSENGGTSDLTLINVQISEVGELHPSDVTENIGTLRGDADSIIDLLTLSGSADGGVGADGGDGVDDLRSAAANGIDGDPPTQGGTGEDANSSGSSGSVGSAGHCAWNITIVGESGFEIGNLNGVGKNGGTGGDGGTGAIAVGGDGGNGGNALTPDGDGANGGSGGNANAAGGLGGDGGSGGNGSVVTITGSCTITAHNLSGGLGGSGGVGGAGGSATGGAGGAGGAGAGAGLTGSNGTPGGAQSGSGGTGNTGNAGLDGSIV